LRFENKPIDVLEIGETFALEGMDELKSETLTELGNILIISVWGSMANLLNRVSTLSTWRYY
tara:strand:+ start:515 stop:700 length:186 start_codon:yes stop_codon:yes gene_type:complete